MIKSKNNSDEYFSLAEDVYLVNGKARSCLYDLKNCELYSISNKTAEVVKQLVILPNFYTTLSDNEQTIVEKVLESDLLIKTKNLQKLIDIKSLKKTLPLSFAWIEVTKKCNLRCSFCYEDSSSNCHEKITVKDFLHIRNELIEAGIKQIQFIGGEPLLLKENLKEMISLCKENFSHIEIFTNGTLIDEKWCKFFKKFNILIALSVHSYIAANHDKITGVIGSHCKVINAINLLEKHGIKYRIATIRTKGCALGKKPTNCPYKIRTDNVRLTGRANISQYTYKMFKEKAITKDTFRSSISRNAIIRNVSGHKCFTKNLYIASNLDVFPCVMERRFTHGNLDQNKLKNILDQNIRLLSKDHINNCKDCEYRYACYDCRPDANGADKLSKPWYCTYDPQHGKWLDIRLVWTNDHIMGRSAHSLESAQSPF